MKIVQINATCGVGSTGKICEAISETLTNNGIENYILYNSDYSKYPLAFRLSNKRYIKIQAIKSRIKGNYGFNSKLLTNRMIKKLDEIHPDIVHLHNIHGHDCNLQMLFDYFREKKISIVWTFHDCWAFTGYCTHFIMAGCNAWKEECRHCVQKKEYSLLFDRSNMLHKRKKSLFDNQRLNIITPSFWLAKMVKQSFLGKYEVSVINNGIDLKVFKPTLSNFREKHMIPKDKKIVLAVSNIWNEKKGLDILCKLSEELDYQKYQIVIVGTDKLVDKCLSSNVISVHKTKNIRELVEIYSIADVFVNPTREDSFPTVNIEALACGTPVVTFDTGGSPEIVNQSCGSVVPCNDISSLINEIERICTYEIYSEIACLNRAKLYDKTAKFEEYINLYKKISEV